MTCAQQLCKEAIPTAIQTDGLILYAAFAYCYCLVAMAVQINWQPIKLPMMLIYIMAWH